MADTSVGIGVGVGALGMHLPTKRRHSHSLVLGRSGFMAAGRPYHSPNPHEVKAVTSASNIFSSQDTIGTLRESSGVFSLKIKIGKYFYFPLISIFDKFFVSRKI